VIRESTVAPRLSPMRQKETTMGRIPRLSNMQPSLNPVRGIPSGLRFSAPERPSGTTGKIIEAVSAKPDGTI
jgi:hypothetical protein